ncbi:hypothetical protein [Streptomyces purpurogeneiscleroticus]|uniref:hypothetical protein n=1 Tax=Streptomyces purpurogeneiscleroticus TaxID=68259 RepID=UPI001CBED1A1|nr:hypothetical protein [Streptomyces purpurogeneiscleroticus]MBZ4016269.1 hypothetical protein [Streptomyces purpurogeneiscleroticus]
MNLTTRRWLLAPLRQLRTHRLMRQHGPSLPYSTAWALIALHIAPAEHSLVRAWAAENLADRPGVCHDRWDELSETEQRRRRVWLHRHGHSPVQLLQLDPGLIESAGIRVTDWQLPPDQAEHALRTANE